MSLSRFEELLHLLLDDDITAPQLDELTQIVSADEKLLSQLRQHLLMSDRLSQYEDELRSDERFMGALSVRVHADEEQDGFVAQVVASARKDVASQSKQTIALTETDGWGAVRGFAGWFTAAVTLLVLAGVLNRDVSPDPDAPITAAVDEAPEEIRDQGVAVLTRVSGLRGEQTADWTAGETIPPGTMEWDAGLLQLEFYCGATVVIEGPASLAIIDETQVVCHSGKLRAHVPEPARGFTVLAPSVELVDLGTEFALEVTDGGKTEVHVFDGTVELYDAKSNRSVTTRRELNAGEAVSVDRNGGSRKIAARDVDFVTPNRLTTMTDVWRQDQLRDWQAFRDSLQHDPSVVAYFPFDRNLDNDRLLIGYGADGSTLEGAIVGCEWSEGRWPDKTSLQFKRPGDRVRISVPGEFESLTYATWLRVDGLDREFNSLLLTDGFDINGPHWQIRRDGVLILGVKHPGMGKCDYGTGSIFNLFRLGQWVHLATVYDNKRACVTHYVNGELATRKPLQEAASGMLKIGNATIGNWSFPPDWIFPANSRPERRVRNFNGCMDELIVFGQALDDQEVRRIYEVGRP